MTKERLEEILNKVEDHLARETRALRADLDSRMPNIVLQNRKKEVELWEDLVEVVKFYLELKDPIERLTEGPRITVDDEGNEHWDFRDAICGLDHFEEIGKAVVEKNKPMETPETTTPDMVNSPSHYTRGRLSEEGLGESIETIDYIYDKLTPEEFKGGVKWNALKYLSREGHKDAKEEEEDMRKVAFYLNYYLYHKKTDGSKELK